MIIIAMRNMMDISEHENKKDASISIGAKGSNCTYLHRLPSIRS